MDCEKQHIVLVSATAKDIPKKISALILIIFCTFFSLFFQPDLPNPLANIETGGNRFIPDIRKQIYFADSIYKYFQGWTFSYLFVNVNKIACSK